MPEYVLKCNKCGYIMEVTCSYNKASHSPCDYCGRRMKIQIGRVYYKIKGKTIKVD